MNAFFQWIRRLFSPRKTPIDSKPIHVIEKIPEQPVSPIEQAHQEIELTCHQIEQSIDNIRSSIRSDKKSTAEQLLNCKKLIEHLDNIMSTSQNFNSGK